MTITKSALLLATVVLTLLPFHARAEEAMKMDHSKMNHGTTAPTDAYADVMAKMHKDMMDVKPTGDVDVDFVRGMIPHHQGALDMAKIAMEKGKDPVIRKLAQDISRAQVSEIRLMKDWLAAHEAAEKAAAAPKPIPKEPSKQPLKK